MNDYQVVLVDSTLYSRQWDADFVHRALLRTQPPLANPLAYAHSLLGSYGEEPKGGNFEYVF